MDAGSKLVAWRNKGVLTRQARLAKETLAGLLRRWYIRIINIRIEPVAAPRGSAPALNNILVSKAAAAIFLYITHKFFGKSDRNESPTTVEAATIYRVHPILQ